MNRGQLYQALDLLNLPRNSYVVVDRAIFLSLPATWRTTIDEASLVVTPEAYRTLAERGWEESTYYRAPSRAGEVAGLPFSAGPTWGATLKSGMWTFNEIAANAIEIEGHFFATPNTAIEWMRSRGVNRPRRRAEDLRDIAAWRAWVIADPERSREFLLRYPPQEYKDLIDSSIGYVSAGIGMGHSIPEQLLQAFAASPYGIQKLRELRPGPELEREFRERHPHIFLVRPAKEPTNTWQDFLRDDALSPTSETGLESLPPSLRTAIEVARQDPLVEPLQAFHPVVFEQIMDDLFRYAEQSVARFGPPPYHHIGHFRYVHEGVVAQLEELRRMGRPLPLAREQALRLAAAAHDLHHHGSTLRDMAPIENRDKLVYPRRKDITTEMASAMALDDWLARKEAPLGMRIAASQDIDGTTYGIPGKVPVTQSERILACADSAPEPTFDEWHKSSLTVAYLEIPTSPPPETFKGWLRNRLAFLAYVKANLTEPAVRLGWGERADRYSEIVQLVLHEEEQRNQGEYHAQRSARSQKMLRDWRSAQEARGPAGPPQPPPVNRTPGRQRDGARNPRTNALRTRGSGPRTALR